MLRTALAGVAAAGLSLVPVPSAATEPIEIPPARVGDAVTVRILDLSFDITLEGQGVRSDRWGRARDVVVARVDGPHPLSFESKMVTGHPVYLDLASGTQIADHAHYIFGDDPGASQPAQYVSFEPNNPDGWPGWAAAGGLLAGRTVLPGDVVSLPFVMTGTRGADRIPLTIEEIAPDGGSRCIRASGAIHYPTFTGYRDGAWFQEPLDVSLDIEHCDDAPYARSVTIERQGASELENTFRRSAFQPGTGPPLGTGMYAEPERHLRAAPVAFDGTLRDGGTLPIPSLEAAQAATTLAPGLVAWKVAHPDGYLVEAAFTAPELQGTLPGTAPRWELTYAAPSGDQHRVLVEERAGRMIPLDVPLTGAYPADVPSLSSWSGPVVSPAGAIAIWRGVAGPSATPYALRWTPLVNQRWFVTGGITVSCDGQPCGAVYGEIWLEHDSGALGTGETPLP